MYNSESISTSMSTAAAPWNLSLLPASFTVRNLKIYPRLKLIKHIYTADGRVITTLSHSQEHTTTVDGFQEPGSFEQSIMYDANQLQIEALLNRSQSCWQRLSYSCRSSRLFNSPCKLFCYNYPCLLIIILFIPK